MSLNEVNLQVNGDAVEDTEPEVASTAEGTSPKEHSDQKQRFIRLPLARIKSMMKMDPDCAIVSQDSVFLVAKATEMFIEFLSKESGKQLGSGKRKTVMRRDVDIAIENCATLCFLDGALE